MANILMPLPDKDFDVTEVAVPWRLLTNAGHQVIFATEQGGFAPEADALLLNPGIFKSLGAAKQAKHYYAEMLNDNAFQLPICWDQIDISTIDGLILPGGHAPGMRQYLGNKDLHQIIADFWQTKKPVGAICHGVITLARATNSDGLSVLSGMKTTSLPKYMERLAYFLTFWKLGKHYRTYPAYVEDEIKSVLTSGGQYFRGPINLGKRGSDTDHSDAFVVEDGRYISARWPGDAYLFTERFLSLL